MVIVPVCEGQHVNFLAFGPPNVVLKLFCERNTLILGVVRVIHVGIVEDKLQTVGQFDQTGVCVSEGIKIYFCHTIFF